MKSIKTDIECYRLHYYVQLFFKKEVKMLFNLIDWVTIAPLLSNVVISKYEYYMERMILIKYLKDLVDADLKIILSYLKNKDFKL